MIQLGGIVLRAPEIRDVDSLYRFLNEWEVIKYLGGFSAGYSRHNLKQWVKAHRNGHDEILWTVAIKRTDECVGHVGLYKLDSRLRKAEFGIVIGRRDLWGKGIGRKVTWVVLDWGFEQMNLHKISLAVLSSNKRAIQLYESLGFRSEGLLRDDQFRNGTYIDVALMSLLENEWAAKKKMLRCK